MKIDLHTHCREAAATPRPTLDIVKNIVAAVKSQGLDGIAVTDHYTSHFGREVKKIVDEDLNGEIIVIPGQEIDMMFSGRERGVIHIVELFLPGDLIFRFVAHPGHPYVRDLDAQINGNIHGIELKNPSHDRDMDEDNIRQIAEKHDLILLTNSDAHRLRDIGTYYNELEIAQLCERVRASGKNQPSFPPE